MCIAWFAVDSRGSLGHGDGSAAAAGAFVLLT